MCNVLQNLRYFLDTCFSVLCHYTGYANTLVSINMLETEHLKRRPPRAQCASSSFSDDIWNASRATIGRKTLQKCFKCFCCFTVLSEILARGSLNPPICACCIQLRFVIYHLSTNEKLTCLLDILGLSAFVSTSACCRSVTATWTALSCPSSTASRIQLRVVSTCLFL